MFDRILVYEDALAETHPALDRAVSLARGSDTELKIIDVVPGTGKLEHDRHRQMRNAAELEWEDRLEEICLPLRGLKITHSTELLRGRPFAEVIREVVHDGFDLVIKSASLAAPNDVSGMMGPVDMRIVRNCPCPVWLEMTVNKPDEKTLLVAVDPQAHVQDLNLALIERAATLASWMEARLHLVAAWEAFEEPLLSERVSPEKLSDYLSLLESNARRNLNELQRACGKTLHPEHVHFEKASASELILDCVDSLEPEVVVMGTVADTDVDGLLIGNTTDLVLRQINRPVLAIKPDALFTT